MQKLIRHELDMICTGATITAQRRQIVDFSTPYLDFDLAIIVHRAGPSATSMADLSKSSIGVRTATTAEQFVRQNIHSNTVHSYHFNTEAYSALAAQALDAVIDDYPIAKGFERLKTELRVSATIAGTRSQYGIMFAKGTDTLRELVDGALRQLQEDGTHAILCEKWFGSGDALKRIA